jgi:hypothetical protein
MVWKYFDRGVELSRRNEFVIWTETAALPFKFSSSYRIAAFFIKKGFETKLTVKQTASLRGEAPLECCQVQPADRKLFLDFFKGYTAIVEGRIASAIVYKKPDLFDIRMALAGRSPVILLVDSYYSVRARGSRHAPHLPHWVVVTGFDGERFYVNDSIHEAGLRPGKLALEARLLAKAMDTYRRFGWPPAMITVRSKKVRRSSTRST